MKNSQKGFIIPLLLGITTLLVIGVGAYVYLNHPKTISQPTTEKSDETASTLKNFDEKTVSNSTTSSSTISITSPNNILNPPPINNSPNSNPKNPLIILSSASFKEFSSILSGHVTSGAVKYWYFGPPGEGWDTEQSDPSLTPKVITIPADGGAKEQVALLLVSKEGDLSNLALYTQVPEDATYLTFDFRFAPKGDGDYLRVYINNESASGVVFDFLGSSFVGPKIGQENKFDSVFPGEISLQSYRNQVVGIHFALHGRRESLSQLLIKNVRLYLADAHTLNLEAAQSTFSSSYNLLLNMSAGQRNTWNGTRAFIEGDVYVRDNNSYENVCIKVKTDMINMFNQSYDTSSKISSIEGFNCVANKNSYALNAVLPEPNGSSLGKTYCLDSKGNFLLGLIDPPTYSCKK